MRELNGDRTTVLVLHVADSEVGKVIGKRGRIADAIRDILFAVNGKQHHYFILEILQPKGTT